jgi:hypothetical protein
VVILVVMGLLFQLPVVQTYLSEYDFYSSNDNPFSLPVLHPGKPEMYYTIWTKQEVPSLRASCFSWKSQRDEPITPVLRPYQQLAYAQEHTA